MQPHFKKCFEAMDHCDFDDTNTILNAMVSPEKETVPLFEPIDTKEKSVEVWLLILENMMRTSIRDIMYVLATLGWFRKRFRCFTVINR